MEKLRIGKIPFLNLFPFFYYLERLQESYFEFIEDVPSVLNKKLRTGEIDVSPSSSIEYLMNEELYELIDNHSISSMGPVKSILLFSKKPLEELRNKTLLVTDKSDTSRVQLEVIANIFLKLNIKTEKSNLTLEEGLNKFPAYLLIGDDAMVNALTHREFYIYDLGELWHIYTGRPFVYALWIVRRHSLDRKRQLLSRLKECLDEIKKDFFKNPEQISNLPSISSLIGAENVLSYWRSLSYDLTESHREGLRLFKKYAERLKELNQRKDSLSYP
ncbi:MAG: menaquinone biosynthesis protein [Thermodesulfovibrionales bacterium]|nr:menaquinone biosynthesis protein [Thermodesulfovibrionales bacterium]